MICTVNGKEHLLEPDETVGRLLERLGLEGRYTLVELNGEALGRAGYSSAGLADGDVVVVARPVAGG